MGFKWPLRPRTSRHPSRRLGQKIRATNRSVCSGFGRRISQSRRIRCQWESEFSPRRVRVFVISPIRRRLKSDRRIGPGRAGVSGSFDSGDITFVTGNRVIMRVYDRQLAIGFQSNCPRIRINVACTHPVRRCGSAICSLCAAIVHSYV